jgi:hypothetical protein
MHLMDGSFSYKNDDAGDLYAGIPMYKGVIITCWIS